LIQPLVIDGVTVLREGETFYGTVKKVHKKVPNCTRRHGWVEWTLDRISFTDASTVQSRILGITTNVGIDKHPEIKNDIVNERGWWVDRLDYAEQHGKPHENHTWEHVGMAVTFVPALALFGPMLLADSGEYSRCSDGDPGVPPILPGTTVVVVATCRDHRVHG
jgi:hypothetical protein